MTGPGYIRVNRRIWEHPLFRDEPYTRREAWLWLISEAAWKERRELVGRCMVTVHRGQVAHSHRHMAKIWGWHRRKAQRFLDLLIAEGMLTRTDLSGSPTGSDAGSVSGSEKLLLTICNYERFQSDVHKSGSVSGSPTGSVSGSTFKKEETNAVSEETLARARAREISISDFKKVFVAIHDPSWRVWQGVKPTPCVFSVEHHANGWWFPSEWPGLEPGLEAEGGFT